ncbi:transketolase [Kineococcus radiotolerans]|uniref:Transketolase n=1 Tax=Kineococcus radiotolerans (strain ATCC BAA-149 / DSM 14245 / SRS30216) TaxID=266940 RepID=A6WC47_KINRD|nr:transketolase [Kineococcus radiotolerans]ABS04386.1 transketolase [Kineococcus radiotolerans SRS30216 = ATCC BAA-149]
MSQPSLEWSDLDQRTVDTARVLAMDAVQRAGNGHPGTAMSLAPVATLLFQKVLRHDPADPDWVGRDRFVLSCGHSSLTLYNQLYLSGYGLELDDLKALRKWGSKTPGHPEHGHTAGVEMTTGPLGQGLSSAVGMAMAARRERGLFDPEAAPGTSPFDHHVYVLCSDGDIEEGVTSEASAIAGVQELGNLVVIYDQNHISIEDDTAIALGEDTGKRYESYGWHVQTIDWTNGGEGPYTEDLAGLHAAIEAAKAETGKPSIIVLRTIIAYPAPNLQNTGKSHGSALGEAEVKATKEVLGFDPEKTFEVSDEVIGFARQVRERGKTAHEAWQREFDAWREGAGERAELFDRMRTRTLPAGWEQSLPVFEPGKAMASRKASGQVLNAIASSLPELWGGSADLAESNLTSLKGEPSFLPPSRTTKTWDGNVYGRVLHFGIREHAMGSILNGIALHGGTRPYGGTFLVFSDYMRPAVRLASIMRLPVTYVWTHDSIGLGEDGPTHQPIEHLASLRAIPGFDVVRPGDANETAWAWKTILETTDRPAGLALSRQDLPTFDRSQPGWGAADGVAKGAYVLVEASTANPEVILIGTGSEVQIAVAAREKLEAEGIPTRVVSMPCREWFDAQPQSYRDTVLIPGVKARVAVEAGIAQGWHDLTGDAGRVVGIEHFGASADYQDLYREFGMTDTAVVTAAKESLAGLQ